jgi:integrase/recombinase XerD
MKHSKFPIDSAIARYLTIQRALGRRYVNEERVLTSLSQFLREQRLEDLEQTGFDAWSQSFAKIHANTRRGRLGIVRNFCLYRHRTEPNCFVPDVNRFPRRFLTVTPSSFVPPTSSSCWLPQRRSSAAPRVR